jgi:hypothetical protein
VCAAIDPAKRADCGYTDSKDQCEAAGCCYDAVTPFTFHCFCKTGPGPGPTPPGQYCSKCGLFWKVLLGRSRARTVLHQKAHVHLHHTSSSIGHASLSTVC